MKSRTDEFTTEPADMPPDLSDESDGLPVAVEVPPEIRPSYRKRLLAHGDGGTGGRAGGSRRYDSDEY